MSEVDPDENVSAAANAMSEMPKGKIIDMVLEWCDENIRLRDKLELSKSAICKQIEVNTELREALDTIKGGYTDRFPGAPDIMTVGKDEFRHGMWTWSQSVARTALDGQGGESDG